MHAHRGLGQGLFNARLCYLVLIKSFSIVFQFLRPITSETEGGVHEVQRIPWYLRSLSGLTSLEYNSKAVTFPHLGSCL